MCRLSGARVAEKSRMLPARRGCQTSPRRDAAPAGECPGAAGCIDRYIYYRAALGIHIRSGGQVRLGLASSAQAVGASIRLYRPYLSYAVLMDAVRRRTP